MAGGDGPAPRYPLESVDRTLLLLRLLAERRELTLSDVRVALDVGQSTAHRLLAMLVYRDFAAQDPLTRAYRPGPAITEIARAAGDDLDLVGAARPALAMLARETGETVHLGTLVRDRVLYLDVIESTATLRVAGRTGQTRPAHATSIGKAMLAEADDEEVHRLYPDEALEARTSRTITHRAALLVELRRIRARGHGRNHGETETGVRSVGIALTDPVRGLIGGLSVAAPTARWNAAVEKTHVAALRRAASLVDDALRAGGAG